MYVRSIYSICVMLIKIIIIYCMHDLYSIWLFFQLAIFVELNLIGRIYTGHRRERQQQYKDDLVSKVSRPNRSGHGLV